MFRSSTEHFYQLIEDYAENEKTKARIAIYNNDTDKITYGELNQRVNRLAHHLLSSKNCVNLPETRVGLFFYLSIDYFISMFALMKAGLTFVPFSPNTEVDRLQEFVKQSHIKLILSNSQLKNNLFLTTIENNIIYLDSLQSSLNSYPSINPDNKVPLNQLAYVHNTSGSTAKPKQVLINHAGLLNCATDLITRLSITTLDKTAAFADISFDAHIAEMMMTLGAGASLYLVPPPTRLDYLSLTKYYNSHGITVSTLTPSVLSILSPASFPSLRVLLSTGEAVTGVAVNKWCESNPNLLFVNGYGPAEVTIATSIAILKPGDPIHIGEPIKGLKMYVLEKDPLVRIAPQWVKPGERGELYISGVGVGRGYSDLALTAERFINVTDPDNAGQQIRLYQTRDEARYELTADKSHQFYVSGRLDRQVKIYGKLICPEEIEALLLAENVIQAQIDPQKTASGHPAFIAYLFIKDPFDLYEYYASIVKKLPAAVAPSRWVISNKTLLSTSSKNALKSLDSKPVRVHAHASTYPSKTLEVELAGIWKQVLEISEEIQFTLDDNFFMMGGTSLHVANLLVILRERFQLKLSLAEFLYIPTLGALARHIARLKNEATKINTPILLNKKHANLRNETPLFLIHSLMGDAELDYEKLVQRWPSQRPIYGISSRSFKNIDDMDSNLDAIANDYLNAMKSIQPRGPYLLGGWSAGGLIAYAMSQILKTQNEKVYLHMLDSEALNVYRLKNNKDYSLYLSQLFEMKLSSMLNIPSLPIAINTLATHPKTKQIYLLFDTLLASIHSSDETNAALLQQRKGLITTVKNTLLAILNYVETTKIDNAILWAATETQKKCKNERLLWLTSEIEFHSIQTLDGNHESILLDPISAKTLGEKLERECALQIEAEQKIVVHYFNRPARNTHSVGRENELSDLQKIFRKIGRNQDLAIICHDKSVGKSQLAADYFNQTTQEYELKLWFRANNKIALFEDYQSLAKQLNLYIVADNAIEAIKAYLGKRKNWLAVYDNAGPMNELKDLLPVNNGHVIVTTQHTSWSDIGFDTGINSLSEKYALSLLKTSANQSDDHESTAQNALMIKFAKLPMDIKQLGAYLKQTQKKFSDFESDLSQTDSQPYVYLINAILSEINNDISKDPNLKYSLDILLAIIHLHASGSTYALLKIFLQQIDKISTRAEIEILLNKSLEHVSQYALIQYDNSRQIAHISSSTQTALKLHLSLTNDTQYIAFLLHAIQASELFSQSNLAALATNIKQYAPLNYAELYIELSHVYYHQLAYKEALEATHQALNIALELKDESQINFYRIHHSYINILTNPNAIPFKDLPASIKQVDVGLKNLIPSTMDKAQAILLKRLYLILNALAPTLMTAQEYADCLHYLNEAKTIVEQIYGNDKPVYLLKIKLFEYKIDYLKGIALEPDNQRIVYEMLEHLPAKQKYLTEIAQQIAFLKTDEVEKWQLLVESCNLRFITKNLTNIISLLNDMATCQYRLNNADAALNIYALAIVIHKKYLSNNTNHHEIGLTYAGLANLMSNELQQFYHKIALWHFSQSCLPNKNFFKMHQTIDNTLSPEKVEHLTTQHKKFILNAIPSSTGVLADLGIQLDDFNEELLEISSELSKLRWKEPGFSIQKTITSFFSHKKIKLKKPKNIKPNLPWLQNKKFTGRNEFLQVIGNHLPLISPDTSSTVLTIHGMSGIGKSQLAVQYAYLSLQAKKYEFVWFLSAANLMDGFLELSDAFNISTTLASAKRITAAKEYLETYYSGKWLIVIDDAKDYETTKTAFNGTSGGHFLITSKNPHTWPLKEELLVFNRTESLNLITKILPRDVKNHPEDAKDLAKLLGDLPLALVQACAYIHDICTIQEYIDLYASQRKELWSSEEPPNDYPTTVSRAFDLSLKAANEFLKMPELDEFLSFCAYLHQDSIPKWLLKCIIPNPLLLSKILKTLLNYSLIQASDEKIAIHPLIQQVMREKLPNASVKVITLLTEQSMTTDYTAALAHNRELLEHYDAVLGLNPHCYESIHLFFIAGLSHLRMGNSSKAKELFESALKVKKSQSTNNDLEYARLLDYLGTAYGDLDLHHQKKDTLSQALEIKLNYCKHNKNFPETDIEFARTYNSLGNAYGETGDIGMQLHYLEKSYHISVLNLGACSSESALIQANLGTIYRLTGQRTKAKQYLEQALSILEDSYGKNHYYVGRILNNLACYFGPMEWDADLMNDLMVDIKIKNDHIECSIIPCIQKQQALIERAVSIYKQNFAQDNINIAFIRSNLAKIYKAANNKTEQIQVLRAIAPVYSKFFGATHKETLAIITQLDAAENASSIKNVSF